MQATPPPAAARDDIVRALLQGWYREQALACLKEKTARYAAAIGVAPRSVSVRDYKARWGSCTGNGDVAYNWRIVQAPHRIVDYVVVHELCHLLEHNHSREYWRHVKRHVRDYQARRDWLKREAAALSW